MNQDKYFVFLCATRDFHAIDWLRSFEKNFPEYKYIIICDSISAEGEKSLVNENDKIEKLFIIDKFLFKSKSKFSNLFRNTLKLILIPIQLFYVYKILKKYKNPIIFAHGAYFIFLATISKIKFVANPVGSEVLVRPFKSSLYKQFLYFSLKKASLITVDSYKMQSILKNLFNLKSVVIQNGIDIDKIYNFKNSVNQKNINKVRNKYTSIRAITPLYNIKNIISARNNSLYKNKKLDFIYPFFDLPYKNHCFKLLDSEDNDLGRLKDFDYFQQLYNSRIVFSIPSSDASPKSVYESIFLGCVLVVKNLEYLEMLPKTMKERIVEVDIKNQNWFNEAIEKSEIILKKDFIPDDNSIEFVNRDISVSKLFILINKVYA
jgi:hypothetical protein